MITSFFKKQDASAKDATDETVSNKRPKLDEPVGKHGGKSYFECAAKCGVLVKPGNVTAEDAGRAGGWGST